jgi:glycosyltransferase involved in cell wall biosynthesis
MQFWNSFLRIAAMKKDLVAIIPVYNHYKALHKILETLQGFELGCILVDDGSDVEIKQHLESVCENFKTATLVMIKNNGGKGAAVMEGLKTAKNLGYTHAMQIDADAQHDLSAIPEFLNAALNNPDYLIAGFPKYDDSAPKSRILARRITNFWVAIETLSMSIKDSMCGFRIYPVNKCCNLIDNGFWTCRMGFDVEIFVRLYWAGVPFLFLPVNVFYFKDNVSHFRMFKDNLEISKLHLLLFFGMLQKLPILLRRKFAKR